MSPMRSRNKFCFSLDNSSNNTSSSDTIHLNRWSEIVPPKTALTFAALWDPEEGMVTFSGPALLESEGLSDIPPHPDVFDDDGHSQLIFDDLDSDRGSTASENTATLVTFQDSFKAFLHRTPLHSKEHLHTKAGQGMSGARASSTFDGLDIYSHDIHLKPARSLQLSCIDLLDIESSFRTPPAFGRLRLRSDLMLDSCRPESEESGSSSESRPPHLRSRFSTTTTSTSDYVDVTASALQLTHTTEISYIPEQKEDCISPASSWPSSWPSLPYRRRLRKRRPLDSGCIASAPNTLPSTPRNIIRKASMSLFFSPSSTATASSPSPAMGREEVRRSRFSRRIGLPPIPALMPTPMTSSPPATPSTPKSPRLKLRFALLPKRKSRQTSPESDGWVLIEVTPIIQQRYMADLAQD